MGSLSTTAANKTALTEAQIALQLYTDYFGPLAYKRVHMTQQTACNYGQAWPGVIYIPTCYYWGPTVRHQLGMQQTRGAYWDTVAPHEVAHLWWGHSVGWNSYRDQWMSEGFSNLSASLFLQVVYPKEPQRFRNFWRDMLFLITERNSQGFRPIEVGPVTQGYRLSSGRTGSIASDVLYPKGAYILHMLRMMMWSPKEGDTKFKGMLRDFISTYKNQPVTTEDFKAMVEKHMLPEVKITQSGVSDGFVMRPIYIELQDGRVMRLGSATLRGNTSVAQKVNLGQASKTSRCFFFRRKEPRRPTAGCSRPVSASVRTRPPAVRAARSGRTSCATGWSPPTPRA